MSPTQGSNNGKARFLFRNGDKSRTNKAATTCREWKCLEEVLGDPNGIEVLFHFMRAEYCEENLLFLCHAARYRKLKDTAGMNSALFLATHFSSYL
jgi:hypothetical protein